MSFVMKNFLNELEEIVNIDTGTYSVKGIEKIGNILLQKFTELGWQTKLIDCGKAGKGVEARNKPEAEHIDIMIIGHMDTVFPEGTILERPMTYNDERAFGAGVADMKAGLLTVIYALRDMDKESLNKLSLCVCMNPDEETGSLLSAPWLQSIATKSKRVLVAEPSRGLGVFTKARKGMAKYCIRFHGKPAHAGNDLQNGRSAITEMAHWVHFINSLCDFEKGSTFSVGLVKGGTGSNVVAEHCEITVDTRFWDTDHYEGLHAKIMEQGKNSFTDGVSVNIDREFIKPSMVPNKETEAYMKLVEECAKEQGITAEWASLGGLSDGNITASMGIPTLDGFGPTGGALHSADEYLELTTIEPRIELLKKLIHRIAHS